MNDTPNEGRDAAVAHNRFALAYQIIKSDRGTEVTGAGPDGRCTGTCDRCGTAILNVYVFTTSARTSYMHVGIDCAGKMGVPLAELKAARGYFAERRRESDRAARNASAAERRALETAAKAARLAENAALVEDIETLKADPRATDWEVNQLGAMIACIASFGADWTDESNDDNSHHWEAAKFRRDTLACIRTRLSLCDTSVPQTEALTGKGKPAGFRKVLRGYRKALVLTGQYGTTYVSFLTDDAGNAYVHKGSNVIGLGETVEATWSIDGSDTRDGLTATVLKRPRKWADRCDPSCAECEPTGGKPWCLGFYAQDRVALASVFGVGEEHIQPLVTDERFYRINRTHTAVNDVEVLLCSPADYPGPKWHHHPHFADALNASHGLVMWVCK